MFRRLAYGLMNVYVLILALWMGARVSAQCHPFDWDTTWCRQGTNDIVHACTVWDPDDDGPVHAVVVIGGEFTYAGVAANHVAYWDGIGNLWKPLEDGLPGTVYALTTWDPDDEGGGRSVLVAASYVQELRQTQVWSWDGEAWRPLGGIFDGKVASLVSWDADGVGLASSRLIAGGEFRNVGNVQARDLAAWDGVAWSEVGGGLRGPGTFTGTVYAMVCWDPDGSGPEAEDLVVAGDFVGSQSGVSAICIARWDGEAWHDVSGGITHGARVPYSLAMWDHDSDPATPKMIVAGGGFTRAGGVEVNHIAGYVEGRWIALGAGSTGWVSAITEWDHDGDGPMPTTIVAMASFMAPDGSTVQRISRWDGSAWQAFDSATVREVRAFARWNPPGATSEAPTSLFAVGDLNNVGGGWYVTHWDIQSPGWRDLGTQHVLNRGQALLLTPPGWNGLTESQLMVGGVGTIDANNAGFARWDGVEWQGIGRAPSDRTACWWDPDGDGPLQAELIAGGSFTSINGVTVNNIAGWNGTSWHAFGSGVNPTAIVSAVTSWDPDGDGPQTPQLVAGGSFSRANGFIANGIARWDGAQWLPFADETGIVVYSLAHWDPDGAGPLPRSLVRGRQLFSTARPQLVSWWDGTTWHGVGASFRNGQSVTRVRALVVWDEDGDGPQEAQLIAAGNFGLVDGNAANNIVRWDPTGAGQWRALGLGVDNEIAAACSWDPDGAGPANPQLVVGGGFTQAGGVSADRIARWDGSRWHALPGAAGISPSVLSVISMPMQDDPNAAPWLVISGNFTYAGGVHSPGVARLRATDYDPQFYDHPASVTTCRYGDAALRAVAVGRGDFEYGWEWRMAPADSFQTVTAGANAAPGGSVQFVAMDAVDEYQLFISGVAPGAVLEFRARVIGECAGATSDSALVNVCAVDYTCDHRVDSADFFEFLTRFFALDSGGDFNADGFINSQDFFEFMSGFFQGC